MDVTGVFAIYIAVGEKAGFVPQLPGACQEESIFLFIASFLFISASADKALHSPLYTEKVGFANSSYNTGRLEQNIWA